MHSPNFKEDFAYGIMTLELEDFTSLIDVFTDVFRRGTANHHPMTSPWNHYKLVCLTFWKKIRISRIIDFRILNYSDYYLLWLF